MKQDLEKRIDEKEIQRQETEILNKEQQKKNELLNQNIESSEQKHRELEQKFL